MKHTHVSTLTAITIACYVIIIGFALRMASAKLADTPWGKGLSFIY